MPLTAAIDSKTAVAAAKENASAASFAALMDKLGYLSAEDIELIRQAYRLADEAHLGQLRKNSEPYITHPIAVASQCAEWKLDAQALMAALLHDTMEDCGITKHQLVERFGMSVADMVDGLTKLDQIEFTDRQEKQAESFRKMLLAMARDVRVILVKLADRTHNMRTLSDVPREKWTRISSETLEIYAPIAHRLGLNQTYRELQDLSFKHLRPWRYTVLSRAVAKVHKQNRDLVQKVLKEVESCFASAGMKVRVSGREKTLYSIYRKMDNKSLSFAQVSDIYGFRVIVPKALDCYTGLGLLHQHFKPLPGKFKDYIAIAKLNGYQSLHTTVIGPANASVEFQLRTEAMDVVADAGIAAHWLYKANEPDGPTAGRLSAQWLQSLLDIQNETHDAAEFWDHVKVDLFPDAVYVFTPQNKIMPMPRGATVVDFAYAIHTDIGDRTIAAKINGETTSLRTALKNGDRIEIITASNAKPNPAWLGFVRTGRARSRIRHYLKSMAMSESQDLGKKLLVQALRAEGLERLPDETSAPQLWDKLLRFTGNKSSAELMTDLGLGKRIASIVAKRLGKLLTDETGEKPNAVMLTQAHYMAHENLSQGAVVLDGSENASVQYAQCCRPIPGDDIVGYLGRGEGLVIHTQQCGIGKRLYSKDKERFLTVQWADEFSRSFQVGILITVTNGQGVLARVTTAMANAEADIVHIDMGAEFAQDTLDLRFIIAVRDTIHLDQVFRSLKRVTDVFQAIRIQPST